VSERACDGRARSALAAAALLGGCAKELPQDKQDYVGLWKSNETSLLITASGRLEYESNRGAVKTSVSAPIQSLTDRQLTAGVLFLKTTFTVDRPPAQKDGVWTMVVDGQELVKADADGRAPQAKVPSLEELRALVDGDLRRLARGVKANDFTEYREHSSLVFQSQFTSEKLKEIWAPLVEKGTDLERYMVGDLALTAEPAISERGSLRIHGRYGGDGPKLQVEAVYLHAADGWKSAGTHVQLVKE
jgi:hypothetical protein